LQHSKPSKGIIIFAILEYLFTGKIKPVKITIVIIVILGYLIVEYKNILLRNIKFRNNKIIRPDFEWRIFLFLEGRVYEQRTYL